jgi:hypothetical protein
VDFDPAKSAAFMAWEAWLVAVAGFILLHAWRSAPSPSRTAEARR